MNPPLIPPRGEREFCSVDLAKWLKSQSQTYFCLRLKKNEYVEIESYLWVQLKHMGVILGVSIDLEGVKVTKTKQLENSKIVGKWKRKYRGWSADEAWFILTNLDDLDLALKAYARRFGLHGRGWLESLDYFWEITQQLMALSPHKKPYYQRGQNAIKLIRTTL